MFCPLKLWIKKGENVMHHLACTIDNYRIECKLKVKRPNTKISAVLKWRNFINYELGSFTNIIVFSCSEERAIVKVVDNLFKALWHTVSSPCHKNLFWTGLFCCKVNIWKLTKTNGFASKARHLSNSSFFESDLIFVSCYLKCVGKHKRMITTVTTVFFLLSLFKWCINEYM